jgi:hypothetical protein
MSRQEKIVLLVLVLAFLTGIITLSAKANLEAGGADAGATVRLGKDKLNASLRTSSANLWRPTMDEGSWHVPEAQVRASGADVLHGNHPLFRRPSHAGENRHKVMTEGWAGWFYNPPSEEYF